MKNIKESYQNFLKLPFPEKLAGEEIYEIDLVSLDTFTAGLIDKYISRKGELSKSDFELLDKFNLELKSITKELKGVELAYFSFLSDLANQVYFELIELQKY